MLCNHNKGKSFSLQLSLLVGMNNPNRVLEEVKIIFQDMFSEGDFTPLSAVFEDVVSLFLGKLPGYKACDTPYHNLKHTTDVFLAVARLLHGAHLQGEVFKEVDVRVGLIAALMHDTGYIQKNSESMGSGAMFSSVHVQRSMDFMQRYLSETGSPNMFISRCEILILSTDLEYPFGRLAFSTEIDKTMAQMIAASDLLAQTADRNYLEKLQLLFQEFQESYVSRFINELGLIKEAPKFNDFIRHRIASELDGVDRYIRPHFKYRWDIDLNMYQEAIDRSLIYLSSILKTDATNYRLHLRRVNGQ